MPAAEIFKLDSANELDEDWPVVFPVANIFPTPALVFPDISSEPADIPTITAPCPTIVSDRASKVLEDDCPFV
jgi:hypothetical protein